VIKTLRRVAVIGLLVTLGIGAVAVTPAAAGPTPSPSPYPTYKTDTATTTTNGFVAQPKIACPAGKFCIYTAPNYTGSQYYWTRGGVGACVNIGDPFNDRAVSVINNSGGSVRVWRDACGWGGPWLFDISNGDSIVDLSYYPPCPCPFKASAFFWI
jgi:peptidase inhibitor family I36